MIRTNSIIQYPDNKSNNNWDIADIESDVEEEVVNNQQPSYI